MQDSGWRKCLVRQGTRVEQNRQGLSLAGLKTGAMEVFLVVIVWIRHFQVLDFLFKALQSTPGLQRSKVILFMRKARVQVRFTAGERTESSCVQSAQGSYVIVWGLPFRDLGGGGICLLGVWYRLFSILLHRHGLCMVFFLLHMSFPIMHLIKIIMIRIRWYTENFPSMLTQRTQFAELYMHPKPVQARSFPSLLCLNAFQNTFA